MLKSKSKLVFLSLDIILIFLAVLISFLLRFDLMLPGAKFLNFISFSILAAVVTPLIFYFSGLYKMSWRYISITDLPNIFKGVLVSGLFLSIIIYALSSTDYFESFPRSVILIYLIILFILTASLRFSKRIYFQVLKSSTSPLKETVFPITSKTLKEKEVKNILITGGAGYLGSVLSRKLLKEGYNVTVYDKLLFGADSVKDLKVKENFKLIEGDIFDKEKMVKAISDADAVVNLAAIVGEAACISQKDIALRTNYLGAVYVARLCKALGIRRFIQASTCSIYGKSPKDVSAKENFNLSPVDFYGETKIYAERELMKLMDNNFNPTILRFSTLYGLSFRMRFDLVVNIFAKKAVKEGEISIFGGDQWRPLIHVADAASAISLVLKSPLQKVGNQAFNVGVSESNYKISAIGKIVKEVIPSVKIKTIETIRDKRNYKIDFQKIEKTLDFSATMDIKKGVIEIKEAIDSGSLGNLEEKKYYNHFAIS